MEFLLYAPYVKTAAISGKCLSNSGTQFRIGSVNIDEIGSGATVKFIVVSASSGVLPAKPSRPKDTVLTLIPVRPSVR